MTGQQADVGVGATHELVSFRAAYEQFPASVKGAFVLRGGDGAPHQVRIVHAHVAEVAGHGSHLIPIEPAILEVAPTLDTFVPFEFPTMELAAGWYRLECDVVVDGVPARVYPGSRFPVAWPRASVRRGTVAIGKKAGAAKLVQLECAGDHVRITYEGDEPGGVKLSADGAPVHVLEREHDAERAKGAVIAYPVLKTQARLAVELKGAATVEIRLP